MYLALDPADLPKDCLAESRYLLLTVRNQQGYVIMVKQSIKGGLEMITLKYGSIFDFDCDMIVIPCNNFGGIAFGLRKSLIERDLPFNIDPIGAGNCLFTKVDGQRFEHLVFAASVNGYDMSGPVTAKNIKRIINQIVEYCLGNKVYTVNMPLLGSGAGNLDALESYDVISEAFSAQNPTICVNVCVISMESYALIQKHSPAYNTSQSTPIGKEKKIPLVFISYSHDNPETCSWGKSLTDLLRSNGIDAISDIYDLKYGEGLND